MAFFSVTVCNCGRLQEHKEVSDYSDCDYESSEMLSSEQLKKAIMEGNVVPKRQNSCEDCAYEQAMELQETN